MRDYYLEVTFRKGRPLAAYLYVPRDPGAKSEHTKEAAPGLLVDYDAQGSVLGIEITQPHLATVEQVNRVLESLGLRPLHPQELAPLTAA